MTGTAASRNAPGSGYMSSNSKSKDDEGPQVVAVAVDGDKNSQHALKWAADHIIGSGNLFALVHVRRRDASMFTSTGHYLPSAEVEDDDASALSAQRDFQTEELLSPFQCFCSRRGLNCREVIVDDVNISKAIVDFVLQHGVDKLVLGASSRNAFSRTFKQADVPTSVFKTAPEFCSVYVICKGNISSSRPATRPKSHHFSGLANDFENAGNSFQSSKSETIARNHMDNPRRVSLTNSAKSGYGGQSGVPWVQDQRNIGRGFNHSGEPHEFSFHSVASCASPSRTSLDKKTSFSPRILDNGRQQPRLSASSNHESSYLEEVTKSFESYRTDGVSSEYGQFPPVDEAEYEMRRLKLELKMAVDKYQDASEKVYYKKANDESNRGDPWLGRERKLEMNKKDEMRSRVQATERKTENESTRRDPWLDRERKLEMNKKDEMRLRVQATERKTENESTGGDPWLDRERKLEMNKKDEMRSRIQATERKMENETTGGDPWLDRERILELNKKEEMRLRVQATERKMEIESDNAIGRENNFSQKIGTEFSSHAQYRKYSITELKEATNNFSESLKIGEGGYGPVFKSTLDHTLVAIKVPRPDVVRGMEQFQQEVEVLSRIRHPNLVLLMGACPEHGCLVYEYMDNGNLEDRLFCRSGTAPLSWQLRFKIAAEIASGLLYLHQSKPEPLVHRDLKPANILLDENFASKITDVGLARLLPSSTSTCSSQYLATVAAGTFCYIDPEYQKTGIVGVKSDVYALGIIILQLITARPPMGLAYNAEDALEMGTFDEMLDHKVPDWPMEETVKLAKLGVMCAELRRRDRPDLASVVLPELNRLRELADVSL